KLSKDIDCNYIMKFIDWQFNETETEFKFILIVEYFYLGT
ncbi:unnamed protein product, partial [marine sediment metagenome]